MTSDLIIVSTDIQIAELYMLNTIRTILKVYIGWPLIQSAKDEDTLKVLFHNDIIGLILINVRFG